MLAKRYRLDVLFFKSAPHVRPLAVRRGILLHIKVYPSDLPYSRFSLVAPNNRFASVAKRNAFRRAFFEHIRTNGFWEAPGRNCVCILLKKPLEGDLDVMRAELGAALAARP
jgi:RNase P protein component